MRRIHSLRITDLDAVSAGMMMSFSPRAKRSSASNPILDSNGQNIFPSIVKARLVGHQVLVAPVLQGNASLIDIATVKKAVALQSDPDSLKVDSAGDLVLGSQADGDLIFINAPGSPNQAALRLQLSNGTSTQITVDDTVFPTAPSGTIYVVDTSGDTVYAVRSDAFQPGGAYSASDSDGILGKVDLSTGLVYPILTGMKSPHGALLSPPSPQALETVGRAISRVPKASTDGTTNFVQWRNSRTRCAPVMFRC